MRWIVTGGAGFIGSEFVRTALLDGWVERVLVMDALTYAGNLENLSPVRAHEGFAFVRCDIADAKAVDQALSGGADALFHFAAESHVDRSLEQAVDFVRTNVLGTQVLLDAARRHGVRRFVHVSTDEVYGSLPLDTDDVFTEQTPLAPTSPYAASKAAADHLVLAAHRTHGLDAVITRCTNNYGPYQFPEKLIPLFVTNAFEGKTLPLYGDGLNVRDWVHVGAHARGVRAAFERGAPGGVYNLGGQCQRSNRAIAQAVVDLTGISADQIVAVADRPAHDRRYAVAIDKARQELGFDPGPPIEERLADVVRWYRDNRRWWEDIKAGEYRSFYERLYGRRPQA